MYTGFVPCSIIHFYVYILLKIACHLNCQEDSNTILNLIYFKLLATDLGFNSRMGQTECYTVNIPGRVAQSVTCLVTDAQLTADPGVASSIPARSHTFVEIDHEIISTVILLPSAESFMKGCCQLQAKVCARLLVNCLFKLAQEKSVVR